MGDPILAMHRHSYRCYELTSLRTGSLRDQMLRATTLVDRLNEAGLIGKSDDPAKRLLVVGAGAAGVCTAMRASSIGIGSVLVERRVSFALQRGVLNRWIDPTEFDWPHQHWSQGQFPAHSFCKSLPLAFASASAADLAIRWSRAFRRWQRDCAGRSGNGTIDLMERTSVQPTDINDGLAPGQLVWQPYSDGPPKSPQVFGAALACTGFGQEDTWAPDDFEGAPFWSYDELLDVSSTTRILVSGGGDGAMQDFLRAATGQFGKPLFVALGLHELDLPLDRVMQAEDICRRLHAWRSEGKALNSTVMAYWHEPYEELCDWVWNEWRGRSEVMRRALSVIQRKLVSWVIQHETPGFCYPLNRLLSMLVVRLIEHLMATPPIAPVASPRVFRPKTKIVKVTATLGSHTCKPWPNRCFGKSHVVELSDGTADEYDVVIVRHGLPQLLSNPNALKPVRNFFGAAPISEQLVPHALI